MNDFGMAGGRVGFLLVHDLGGTPSELHYLAGALHRSGYTVQCCQLPGHGGTQAQLVASTWQDWSAAVASAYADLRKQCPRVVAGGLSTGAILALDLAVRAEKKPDGLLLLAPGFHDTSRAVPWYSFLTRRLETSAMGRFAGSTEAVPNRMHQVLSGDSSKARCLRPPPESLRQLAGLLHHVKPRLGSIKCPALALHTRDDDRARLPDAALLQRKLGGLIECVVLNDCHHTITIDQQRDHVVDKTLRFTEWLEAMIDEQARRKLWRAMMHGPGNTELSSSSIS